MACGSDFGIRQQPWELRDYENAAPIDDDDGDLDPDTMSPTECSTEFFNMLVHLKMAGVLSAKQTCILSFWAQRGGICDPGGALAVHPLRVGGAFSKHFDKTVGLDKGMNSDFYKLPIPSFERWSLGRTVLDIEATPVHMKLAEEIATTPDFWGKVHEAVEASGWSPRYKSHELFREHGGDRLIPLALYADGVPFLKRDSAIGFWFENLATGRRVLALVLRKRQMCRCGCKQWCSLFVAFEYLRWLCATMASGQHPLTRHDGTAWPEGKQAEVAGMPLGYRAVTVCIKADWAEFCHTFGFPSWAHHGHPCFKCFCTSGPDGNMRQFEDVSVLGLPWPCKDAVAYEAACRDAEIRVLIGSAAQLAEVLGRLQYDKRKKGSHGRSMLVDYAPLGLLKGDRVEPTPSCPDVGLIDEMSDFPCELVFWRPDNAGLCKHRNPLFHESSGVSTEALVVDEMHTMHLGVFAVFVCHTLWAVIAADVWKLGENLAQEVGYERSAQKVQKELTSWYARQRRENPGKPVYELADFNLKVLGTRESPGLSAKAAETGSLLGFATDLCREHQTAVANGAALTRAGDALLDYMEITRRGGPRLSPAERQQLMNACLRFLTLRVDADLPWTPKMHLMLHLVHQCREFGNPRAVATWLDEGLNRQLAAVCKTSHALVWHRRVLATMSHLLGPHAKGVKRRTA